jgi:predicted CXXCH cytochrome family protein
MRAWLVVCIGVVTACRSPAVPSRVAPATAGGVASNVLRTDYAGSQACGDCHEAVFSAWQHSPMRNMTRDVATATIRAPFDGATVHVGSDTATMESQGGARFMRVETAKGVARYRVTKVIGGRYREDFVGIDVTGATNPVTGGIGVERVLPATFVFSSKTWRYKGYSVMVKERPAMSVRAVWANECIACHNTLPLATMLYDELFGPGLPSYQGKLSDRVLPESRTWTASSRDDAGLSRALTDEIRFLGGDPPANTSLRAVLPAAATASEQYLDGKHLVELGVGCEACHNGARAHAAEPALLPSFAVHSAVVGVTPPHGQSGTRAQWINHTCAKCHTVLFTRYPYTWEGGGRTRNPGGSTTNSGEGRDFQLGGCASQMPCTTCHDPHAADAPAALAALATPAGNHTCLTCHPVYAGDEALARHTHHAKGSAGTACVACHMPKKNMGLDYALVRYHRIGSPTDPRRVLGDRPVECALCHADKTVESLVSTMESWWHEHYDRAPLRALYGDDLNVNAIRATLERGKPHEQAVAMATLGQIGDRQSIAAIARQLSHEYPLVRFFAQRALETITGQPVPIDLNAPAATIRGQADAWTRAALARP